ncbi:unnamed protein product [Rotaria sordida]|uniref:Uncharacterized protein n=1 Tax=Rotaria sordida TaxID=392033 RepID=A0A815BDW2_9BILA|nr:unnamed protein product [Rotaria sordida]
MNQNKSVIELIFSQASQSQISNVRSDKSKVFHLGKVEDYRKKSKEYMKKTLAYKCLGKEDPLSELIQRTNKYLLDLRLAKWITQKQSHKPGTPLRPIISGLKHPTIKISKFLDDLLRPLFDKMAHDTTVTSGLELIKKLQEWSRLNMNENTIFCTINVIDLYTMIPQKLMNIDVKNYPSTKRRVIPCRPSITIILRICFCYERQIRYGPAKSPPSRTRTNISTIQLIDILL